jgi:hypothetical protein
VDFHNFNWNAAVQALIAVAVVGIWAIATASGQPGAADLHDAALVVLSFFFGANVHSAGVASGAAAATLTLPH